MQQKKNPVLGYDWERDIEKAGFPAQTIPGLERVEFGDDGDHRTNEHIGCMLLQADPEDYIELKEGVAAKQRYHAHAKVWKETLDKYIYEYAVLMDALSARVNSDDWIDITVPESFENKYKIDQKKRAKVKKKGLPVKTEYLEFVPIKKNNVLGGDGYRVPRIGKGIYLNQLCRRLYTSSSADKKLYSVQYDGMIFRPSGESDFIPAFELEEYWMHEMNTGICLSIEIAAVSCEMRRTIDDKQLWDKAFEEFCKNVLPWVVRSPYIFTRNAVARYFFQQIHLDHTTKTYSWNDSARNAWTTKDGWNDIIQHASSHSQILKATPYPDELPEEQIEEALAHLRDLLSAVKAPVDIMAYVKNPTHGLALFCNPEHKYVSVFLDELKKFIEGKKDPNKVINIHKGKEENAFIIFDRVRRAVKAAIDDGNIPLEDSKQIIDNIHVYKD